MFHGNGGNHGHRIPLARIFFVKMRCNVLMLSYRGCVSTAVQGGFYSHSVFFFFLLDSYGHSEGSPSEAGKLPTITG